MEHNKTGELLEDGETVALVNEKEKKYEDESEDEGVENSRKLKI